MRRQALDHLREAIEANTERRSIEQLKAQGKRHVRVVSGEKVLRIIKAIVSDIVDREVGELSERDRERIVAETKQQFDRVLKLQNEQDALLVEQKNLVAEYREKLARADGEREQLVARIKQMEAAAEQHASALEADLERVRTRGNEAVERLQKTERIMQKLEARHVNLRRTCTNYDRELQRQIEVRKRLEAEIAALRERAGENEAVGELRGELDEMKSFLRELSARGSGVDEETVSTLLDRLSQRESVNTSSLEARFNASLDASLDKITKTMEAATAKPIDVAIEATDVVIDKLFDHHEEVLSSNLDELEVDVRTTKSGIGGNLAALKALRAGRKPRQDEPEPAQAAADAGEAPGSQAEPVPAGMDRLRPVRKGEEKDG